MPILLFIVFILLPLAELYVIVQVGQAIGIWLTLGLLLADGFLGAALTKSQGRAVWTNFNRAMAEGRMPGREVVDGAMVVFGGALLLSPGFLTDVLGIGLLLPPGRAIVRRMLKGAAKRTPAGRPAFFVYERFGGVQPGGARDQTDQPGAGGPQESYTRPQRPSRPGSTPSGGDVVEGSAREVADDEPQLGEGPAANDREDPRA